MSLWFGTTVETFQRKILWFVFIKETQKQFFFQVYTINLCKIDCRIKHALKLCGCIPFFYAIPNVKICDVDGMFCLSKTTWHVLTSCECPSLCETIIMTKVSKKEVTDYFNLIAAYKFTNVLFIYSARSTFRSDVDYRLNFPKNSHSAFSPFWLCWSYR